MINLKNKGEKKTFITKRELIVDTITVIVVVILPNILFVLSAYIYGGITITYSLIGIQLLSDILASVLVIITKNLIIALYDKRKAKRNSMLAVS